MRIIVIATGALAWRAPSHRTARRAAPVDHASEEEARWREMNTYGDASVAPPPAPPARKARRLDAGDGLAAAFPSSARRRHDLVAGRLGVHAGGGPRAGRRRRERARVPHEQHHESAPFPPPPDAAPPIPPRRRKTPRTLYDDLGCARDASPSALRAAWARLCRRHHPDSGRDASPEMFARVMAAWARLGSPEARATYDAELLREERLS